MAGMGVKPNILAPRGKSQWVNPVSHPEFVQPVVTTQWIFIGMTALINITNHQA
jgi:hypothetical protein